MQAPGPRPIQERRWRRHPEGFLSHNTSSVLHHQVTDLPAVSETCVPAVYATSRAARPLGLPSRRCWRPPLRSVPRLVEIPAAARFRTDCDRNPDRSGQCHDLIRARHVPIVHLRVHKEALSTKNRSDVSGWREHSAERQTVCVAGPLRSCPFAGPPTYVAPAWRLMGNQQFSQARSG
jgi:hypothetical protein